MIQNMYQKNLWKIEKFEMRRWPLPFRMNPSLTLPYFTLFSSILKKIALFLPVNCHVWNTMIMNKCPGYNEAMKYLVAVKLKADTFPFCKKNIQYLPRCPLFLERTSPEFWRHRRVLQWCTTLPWKVTNRGWPPLLIFPDLKTYKFWILHM